MYKAHCQRILDSVVRANFHEVRTYLQTCTSSFHSKVDCRKWHRAPSLWLCMMATKYYTVSDKVCLFPPCRYRTSSSTSGRACLLICYPSLAARQLLIWLWSVTLCSTGWDIHAYYCALTLTTVHKIKVKLSRGVNSIWESEGVSRQSQLEDSHYLVVNSSHSFPITVFKE